MIFVAKVLGLKSVRCNDPLYRGTLAHWGFKGLVGAHRAEMSESTHWGLSEQKLIPQNCWGSKGLTRAQVTGAQKDSPVLKGAQCGFLTIVGAHRAKLLYVGLTGA